MRIVITLVTLFFINFSIAAPMPPAPADIPPGDPIDGGLWILFSISLLLGIYKIYKNQRSIQ